QVVEERRPPPREPGPRRLSRREFLTAPARLLAPEEEPPAEIVRQERPLHPAVHYGVSQALLRAVAMARRQTMAEVIAEEWGLPAPERPVPIHAQCGGDRYHGADKMIARRLTSLPHALVDDIDEQLGRDAARLVQYARWLRARIEAAGGPDYRPTIHLDVHGALGKIYDNVLGKVLGDLYALERAVAPLPLRVESPVIMDSLPAQLEALRSLRDYIRIRKMQVQIVADEWANTLEDIRQFIAVRAADMIQIKMPDMGGIHHAVEAVLACKAAGIGAFLGGSCVETDLSARTAVHVALATQPAMILARPGMGVDEAAMITQNEMARALACICSRRTSHETNPDTALKH
ncbi:MAG: methylaspartate ammonia-lyase, partial [Anaerolineae bacterium]